MLRLISLAVSVDEPHNDVKQAKEKDMETQMLKLIPVV